MLSHALFKIVIVRHGVYLLYASRGCGHCRPCANLGFFLRLNVGYGVYAVRHTGLWCLCHALPETNIARHGAYTLYANQGCGDCEPFANLWCGVSTLYANQADSDCNHGPIQVRS